MALDAVATGLSGIGGAAPSPEVGTADAPRFDQALAGQHGAGPAGAGDGTPPMQQATLESRSGALEPRAETAGRRAPAPEVSSGPHRSGESLGHRILDRVGALQKGDAALRTSGGPSASGSDGPSLKVAARTPGPAEAMPRPDGARQPDVAGHVTTQPGQSQNPGFDSMLNQLQQVSGQVIQVSVVSKTTGSFTGSLNKLISSG